MHVQDAYLAADTAERKLALDSPSYDGPQRCRQAAPIRVHENSAPFQVGSLPLNQGCQARMHRRCTQTSALQFQSRALWTSSSGVL